MTRDGLESPRDVININMAVEIKAKRTKFEETRDWPLSSYCGSLSLRLWSLFWSKETGKVKVASAAVVLHGFRRLTLVFL